MALRWQPCQFGVRYTLAGFGGAHSRIISGQPSPQHQSPKLAPWRAFSPLLASLLMAQRYHSQTARRLPVNPVSGKTWQS